MKCWLLIAFLCRLKMLIIQYWHRRSPFHADCKMLIVDFLPLGDRRWSPLHAKWQSPFHADYKMLIVNPPQLSTWAITSSCKKAIAFSSRLQNVDRRPPPPTINTTFATLNSLIVWLNLGWQLLKHCFSDYTLFQALLSNQTTSCTCVSYGA